MISKKMSVNSLLIYWEISHEDFAIYQSHKIFLFLTGTGLCHNLNVKMHLSSISSATLKLCLFIAITAASQDPAHLTGDISVNCGSTETSAALDGREWIGDEHTAISSSLQIKGSSTSSNIYRQSIISANPVPYKTARISHSQFSYAFKLNPGYKLIRLHFSPFLYRGFKGSKDFFTVEAGPFILLRNFSAALTADALGVKYFAKEYCICITENQPFNIIFYPDQFIQSQIGTYAFINGIEIIAMAMHLSYFHIGNLGVQAVGIKSLIHIDNNSALEIIHRHNIKPNDDFVNMFAMGPTLPKQNPNKANNFTWKISVDVGFKYLVRIHFCEIGLKMAETGRVIFKILINEIIVNTNNDLIEERNDNDILWHRDYMVMMQGRKQEGKRHILISLQSIDEFMDKNGPLKGFQILKLNNPDNSLASPNPLPPTRHSPSQALQNILGVFGDRNTIASAAITIVALVNIVVYKLRQVWEHNSVEEENKPSAKAQRLCRRFSLAEILSATKNFDASFVIGRGGFGNVYKGLIDNGQETVAIKRLKYSSTQGEYEFWTEIETLSELRHLNLVSLIGYSNEQQEMVLVYDYMIGGTLADHLYKKSKDNNDSSLSWMQCLNICIGAGRGLDYLHTGHGIIHRDVKASNILLDENFVAKVSDFGLAKPENRSTLQSHVSTIVKGTYGYLDPYYFRTGNLTTKSDTYAFGVVLLEVLCGRPAVDLRAQEDMRSLTSWACENISKGELERIISSNLRGEISPESLKAFVRISLSCLEDEPKKRPTMHQVVSQLMFALELQKGAKSPVPNERGVAEFWPSTEEILFSPSIGETDVRRTTSWDVFGKRGKPSSTKDLEVSRQGQNKLFNESQDWRAEDCATDIEVAEFDWVTIEDATNKFSYSNKIGKDKGGTFYEAVLPTGQIVAVKRTSRSEYGRNMFKTELSLLSKLQHPNILKLLGYFNDGEEMILVYECEENTSLDAVLFERRYQLPWTLRFKIILGIARGALYLHQDSGLRTIYGDLESRNILLDIEMKPKIAFNFMDKYAIHDINQRFTFNDDSSCENFSFDQIAFPSDIYSFGVIVLEIVSGRRHNYLSTQDGDLITCAWNLWHEKKELDMMDASMGTKFSKEEALRCIHIGLLCTQQEPQSRPDMPLILEALQVESQDLQLDLWLAVLRKKI